MSAGLRRCLGCQSGAAAVEFAIVSVVLVSLCIAAVDFGRTLYVKNQLSYLADQAARKVLLDPDISNTTLTAELQGDFSAGDPNALTVTVTTDTSGSTAFRVVTITFPMTMFIPNLTSSSLDLSVTRRMPSE